jgi:hypothetical protein
VISFCRGARGGRRSRFGSVVLNAELHKRSHQVVEKKGFPILALSMNPPFGIARRGSMVRCIDGRKCKNKPTLSADLLRFFGVHGSAPPSGEDALRLSSVWHAGRKMKSDWRAIHLLSPAREGLLSAEVQKQTHFSHLST